MSLAVLQRMIRESDPSVQALHYLLACRGECEWLDYKESLSFDHDSQLAADSVQHAISDDADEKIYAVIFVRSAVTGSRHRRGRAGPAGEGIGNGALDSASGRGERADSEDGPVPRFVVNARGAGAVQVGDGNVQRNEIRGDGGAVIGH